jgi:hypothetical protein
MLPDGVTFRDLHQHVSQQDDVTSTAEAVYSKDPEHVRAMLKAPDLASFGGALSPTNPMLGATVASYHGAAPSQAAVADMSDGGFRVAQADLSRVAGIHDRMIADDSPESAAALARIRSLLAGSLPDGQIPALSEDVGRIAASPLLADDDTASLAGRDLHIALRPEGVRLFEPVADKPIDANGDAPAPSGKFDRLTVISDDAGLRMVAGPANEREQRQVRQMYPAAVNEAGSPVWAKSEARRLESVKAHSDDVVFNGGSTTTFDAMTMGVHPALTPGDHIVVQADGDRVAWIQKALEAEGLTVRDLGRASLSDSEGVAGRRAIHAVAQSDSDLARIARDIGDVGGLATVYSHKDLNLKPVSVRIATDGQNIVTSAHKGTSSSLDTVPAWVADDSHFPDAPAGEKSLSLKVDPDTGDTTVGDGWLRVAKTDTPLHEAKSVSVAADGGRFILIPQGNQSSPMGLASFNPKTGAVTLTDNSVSTIGSVSAVMRTLGVEPKSFHGPDGVLKVSAWSR